MYINGMSFDMAGNDKIMPVLNKLLNSSNIIAHQHNIPNVSPVIYCSALSYLRLASDHVGICRQLIG